MASNKSLRTKAFNKFAVRKDSKYINSRDKPLAKSRNRPLKADRIHKSPCKGGEETFLLCENHADRKETHTARKQ